MTRSTGFSSESDQMPHALAYWEVPKGLFDYRLRQMIMHAAEADRSIWTFRMPSDLQSCIFYAQGATDPRRKAACLHALGGAAVFLDGHPGILATLFALGVDPNTRGFGRRSILSSVLTRDHEQSLFVMFSWGATPSPRQIEDAMSHPLGRPNQACRWILGWFREMPDPERRNKRLFPDLTTVPLETVDDVAAFLRAAAPADLESFVESLEDDMIAFAAFTIVTDRLAALRRCLTRGWYRFFVAFIRDPRLIQVLVDSAEGRDISELKHAVWFWGATPHIRFRLSV